MSDDTTFEPAETYEVDDLETLQIITEETRIEIIELLRNPLSVAELAERMDVPRTRLYHHIKLLEDIEAIRVVDERRAGAMTEKIYRVAAKSFQPSQAFLERATPKDRATAIIDSLFSITRTDFVRAAERELVDLEEARKGKTVSMSRRVFRLTPDRVAEMVQRIEDVLTEFGEDEETDESMAFGVLVVAHPSSRSIS